MLSLYTPRSSLDSVYLTSLSIVMAEQETELHRIRKSEKQMKAAPAQAIMLFFLFLILGIYLFQPKQTQITESGGLKGLHSLNIQSIGPWVVAPSGVLIKPDPEVLSLSNELCALTQERLKSEAVQFDAKEDAPKLKLLLNYGNGQSKLALRGTRQLNSLKLVLEDDVNLNRQPARVVPLVTWSASIDTAGGSGSAAEIREQYSQLLNLLLNDLRVSRGDSPKSQAVAERGLHAAVMPEIPREFVKACL
ncbi:MAG: hypothetical protein SFY67_06150 [Candidatus Melainabacteria bacterium]|nr:hypothetical protein [Candidatus Melainabacteria bacterium]